MVTGLELLQDPDLHRSEHSTFAGSSLREAGCSPSFPPDQAGLAIAPPGPFGALAVG